MGSVSTGVVGPWPIPTSEMLVVQGLGVQVQHFPTCFVISTVTFIDKFQVKFRRNSKEVFESDEAQLMFWTVSQAAKLQASWTRQSWLEASSGACQGRTKATASLWGADIKVFPENWS